MSDPAVKLCIYPGCERPAVAPHLLGGPQPSFCDLEEHNALTAHQERRRRARAGAAPPSPTPAAGAAPPSPIPAGASPDPGGAPASPQTRGRS